MTCRDLRIKERLPDFLSGDLSPEEEGEVRNHLVHCAGCREELDLVGFFAADRDIKLPPGFRVSLPERNSPAGETGGRWFLGPIAPVWAGGLAAAILVLLFLGPWESTPPAVDDSMLARYLIQETGVIGLGLEEEILSVPGLPEADVDQTLDPEIALSEGMEDVVPLVDGFTAELLQGMDAETVSVFEGLLDEMAPHGAERG